MQQKRGGELGEKLLRGYKVGYRVVDCKHSGAVPFDYKVAIWYPTDEAEKESFYLLGENQLSASLARDSKVKPNAEPKSYPLVVYCHGAAGCGAASFFLTEALARHGYIVAAPDFNDNQYSSRLDQVVPKSKQRSRLIWNFIYSLRDTGLNANARIGRTTYGYRPIQTNETIAYMLAKSGDPSSVFFEQIDGNRVGLVGHSFGAWTALLVGGAESRYANPRVKAVVALSGPANENVFAVDGQNDLNNIKVPVMFQFGSKEKLFKRGDEDRKLFAGANRPKILASIDGANHFDFSGGTSKEFDTAGDYIRKCARRAVITNLTLCFFDTYLKDKSRDRVLTEKTDGLRYFDCQLTP